MTTGERLGPNVACVLAAEVRALREELGSCEEEFGKPLRDEIAQLKTDLEWQVACCKALHQSQAALVRERDLAAEAGRAAELRIVELRATIARAEELAHKWRKRRVHALAEDEGVTGAELKRCADELEKLMQGEP